MKKRKPLVSVVIPSYNAERYIENCLNSLQRQKTVVAYEIIVVDSSSDATPEIISEKFPTVKLLHLEQQTYPGAGRNIGVKEAQSEILAFIDSDCRAAENWLEQGMEAIRSGYSIVGGSVRNGNPGLISWPDYFLTFNEFMPTMPSREVQFMPTCNFMCTRQIFEKIGGFDATLFAGEDTLFCYRALQHTKLFFDNSILVSHHNRVQFWKFLRHHFSFGKHSAQLRRKMKLPGSVLARYPLLMLAVPFIRLAMISMRMVRWNRKALLLFIVTSPLLLLGVGAWSVGFMKEAFKKEKV